LSSEKGRPSRPLSLGRQKGDGLADEALALEVIATSEGRLAALAGVIAWRVRSRSRELGLSSTELARRTGLSKPMISKIQAAQGSPSLQSLLRLADALEMPVTSLFQGLDEERDALFTRAGAGPELGRPGTRSGHRYQLLGSMRGPAKRMEPMLVTLTSENEVFPLYQHPGTELLYMLEGEMDYGYGGAVYEMHPGDSLQLDGEVPHGPVRLSGLPVRFLSVTAYGPPPSVVGASSVHEI
jgi:transcriptional regulator with XRE-family HTH domain